MAETGAQLGARNGQPFPVLASRGSEAVADEAAERCARAHRDLASLLGSTPHLRVFVLDEADWRRRAMFPLYGMPPYADERTLVIAGEETDFWHAVSPPEAAFPADLPMRMISSPCTSWPASSTHSRAGVPPAVGDGALLQPCLHAYVARAEPERLAALETLPAAVVAVGQRGLAHRTLEDLERLSVGVSRQRVKTGSCGIAVGR